MNRLGYVVLMGAVVSSFGAITGWSGAASTVMRQSAVSPVIKTAEVARPHSRDVSPPGSLSLDWVLPKHLPTPSLRSKLWPLYNTALAMNQLPASWHGIDAFNQWRLPPRWARYLFKNEVHIHPSLPPTHQSLPLTLYITLQGTVFLFPQTISGTQWMGPGGYVADIPPSTIVAEFVPLTPAIRAGIIPESHGQPWLGSGFVPKVWQRALDMSTTQIFRALR